MPISEFSTCYVIRHPDGGYYHQVFNKLAQDLQAASRYPYRNTADSQCERLKRETGKAYVVEKMRCRRDNGFLELDPDQSTKSRAKVD